MLQGTGEHEAFIIQSRSSSILESGKNEITPGFVGIISNDLTKIDHRTKIDEKESSLFVYIRPFSSHGKRLSVTIRVKLRSKQKTPVSHLMTQKVLVTLRKQKWEVEPEQSARQVLASLDLDPERFLLILNGEMVQEDAWLRAGDHLKLAAIISGG